MILDTLADTLGLNVLHVDADIIVVEKPAWLLSVPGRGENKQDSVYSRVLTIFRAARVVHRLDMATSGVMVLALHLEAQRQLNRQFSSRLTQKRYLAEVYGDASDVPKVIDLPLRCNIDDRPRQIVDFLNGKPSLTNVEVLSVGRYSRLALTPITGRSHQLRVHLLAIGLPIVGDKLYSEQAKAADRMHLHAVELTFRHPRTDKNMHFLSDCPF